MDVHVTAATPSAALLDKNRNRPLPPCPLHGRLSPRRGATIAHFALDHEHERHSPRAPDAFRTGRCRPRVEEQSPHRGEVHHQPSDTTPAVYAQPMLCTRKSLDRHTSRPSRERLCLLPTCRALASANPTPVQCGRHCPTRDDGPARSFNTGCHRYCREPRTALGGFEKGRHDQGRS